MKTFLLLLLPLVAADLYKETQNFQYSRTGDGEQKKGYFGSQSGNMGGNFEVSHNMDTTAQRQMKGLVQQVGSELGINPDAIGTGAIDELGQGTVFGSASTRGTAFGVKGITDDDSGMEGRYNTESRRAGSQSFGTQQREFGSTYGSRASGQRVVGSSYDEGLTSHGGMGGVTSQSGTRLAAGHQGGGRYTTGTRYQAGSRSYQSSNSRHGETGTIHGSNMMEGQVPLTGVRQVGLNTEAADTQYAGSRTRYREGYQQVGAGEAQSQTGESVVRPVYVRPGSTVRLTVAPNEGPVQIPIIVRPGNQRNVEYDATYRESNAQTAAQSEVAADGESVYGVGADSYGQTGGARAGASTGKGYQASYSYQKEWESKGSADRGVQLTPGLTHVGRVTDMGGVAQNRNKLLVAGAELESGGHGSTVYNSGSRVASTGRRYGGSEQTYRESHGESQRREHNDESQRREYNGESQRREYNSESSRGDAYNIGTTNQAAIDGTHSDALGSNDDLSPSKPKTYQSSYSYEKSWEKHGTPYSIKPVGGSLTGNSEFLNNQDLSGTDVHGSRYGEDQRTEESSIAGVRDLSQVEERASRYGSGQRTVSSSMAGARGEDLSRTEAHGSSYGTNQRAASSSYNAGQRSEGTYGGSQVASGASSNAFSTDMAVLQQKLRDQMKTMCTDCGNSNTKGYSAHYSYSAQRSYGGAADNHDEASLTDLPENKHRYKRGAYNNGKHISNQETDDLGQHTFNAQQLKDELNQLMESLNKEMENMKRHTEEIVLTDVSHSEDLGQQTEDLGQQTQGFEESDQYIQSHYNPKLHIGTAMNQNVNLGQETEDLGQQTENLGRQNQGFGEIDAYSQTYHNPKLQIGSGMNKNVHLGQETEDLGQQTQGFGEINPYSQNYRNPKLQLGSTINQHVHLGQETEDLGQHTEDLGQQTQGFGESDKFIQNHRNPKLQPESAINQHVHLGQETENLGHQTEDLGQQTQGFGESDKFIQNHYNPKLQLGSAMNQHIHLGQETENLGQQTEDLGQQTQGFGEINPYSQNYRNPKLQLGSAMNQHVHMGQGTEDLGQQTEDLGQQTQGFGEANAYSQNYRSPKLQLGSAMNQHAHLGQESEDLGQQTEDLGQQTQGFGEIDAYSQNYHNPKLQLGSARNQHVYLGQETEDLGQQTEDLGQQTQGFGGSDVYSRNYYNPKSQLGSTMNQQHLGQEPEEMGHQTEFGGKLRGKTQSNIVYDNEYPELQVPSILQENEFFGKQAGNVPMSESQKGIDGTHMEKDANNLHINQHNKPVIHSFGGFKTSTEKNIRLQNTRYEQNNLQKVSEKEGHFKREENNGDVEVDIDSHIADMLKALGTSTFHNDGHNTESKLETLQNDYKQQPHNKVETSDKPKATVDIEFNSDLGSLHPLESQKDSGWGQQTLMVEEPKTKPLTSYSHVSSHEDQDHDNGKSFLDLYPPQSNSNDKNENEHTVLTTQVANENHYQTNTQSREQKPSTMITEPEVDDGGQQTLETQWEVDTDVQIATGQDYKQTDGSYTNTHPLLTQSSDQFAQEKKHELSENHNTFVEVTTTEKPGFWQKVGGGIGKTKEKVKSWFG